MAQITQHSATEFGSFSPLHEGDTSVARAKQGTYKVTFTFQSPSRGGHLCGFPPAAAMLVDGFSPLHEGDTSVAAIPFGTAPCRNPFQSPSRGGHLCGL